MESICCDNLKKTLDWSKLDHVDKFSMHLMLNTPIELLDYAIYCPFCGAKIREVDVCTKIHINTSKQAENEK